ncbi:HAMP domain-containing protein [bacterium]|nr:HAMP domain-containing protein [bacterium]
MIFQKLKNRLIAAFIFLSLFPAIPLSFLFQSMMEKVFNLGFSRRMELALEDGVKLSRTILQNEKKICLENTRQLMQASDVRRFLVTVTNTKIDNRTESRRLYESLKSNAFKFDGIAVRDADQLIFIYSNDNSITQVLNDRALFKDALESQIILSEYREDGQIILTGLPFLTANQKPGILLSVVQLKSDFTKQSENILAVFQFYKTFGLERDAITRSFLFAFLTVYLLIIAVSIGIAVFFSSTMTRPIQELVYGTDQISKGNWDYQIAIESRQDEIGKLTNSFNRMVLDIKQQQQRLLFLEKMSTWREIAQRLAHEIKNPLTPIQLTIQQLKDSYKGDDERYRKTLNDCYEIVQEEIESLRNLTKEFSEFARMPVLAFKSIDLTKVVRDVSALYAKIPIELLLDEIPSIEADIEAIKRVLINLLENASSVVASKNDGKIVIRLYCKGEFVHISVADNGTGIPKDLLGRIFEPHFSTKSTGMGLGLAIVKTIIEEHRGQINVESVQNLGTTFFIQLPLKHIII